MVSPTLSCCEHSLNTMRYADRVKELNPSSSGNENGQRHDEDSNGHLMDSEESNGVMLTRDDGVLSPEDSDLAQLRSLNEGELSADWYNFQVLAQCDFNQDRLKFYISSFPNIYYLTIVFSLLGSHITSSASRRRAC